MWLPFCLSIATGYGLDGRGSNPGKGMTFLRNVETSFGAHPAFYSMGAGSDFSRNKAAGASN
jgi:hypothetical protein